MSDLSTTYFGRRISIEPFEWGYLALVELDGDKRLVSAHSTAMQALERAFDVVDSELSLAPSPRELPSPPEHAALSGAMQENS